MSLPKKLEYLEAEGVGVSLSLKLRAETEPSSEVLNFIREHRGDLITLLASQHLSGTDYYLNIETSSGKAYVMAKPHHLKEALSCYPWGVLSDSEGRLITSWGEVPSEAFEGKRNLVTGEPIVPLKDKVELEALT